VFSRDELSELPVELHTQFFKSSEKGATLSVICRVDPRHIEFKKAGGRNGNVLSGIVKSVNFNMKVETLAKMMTTGVMTVKTNFSVPPGRRPGCGDGSLVLRSSIRCQTRNSAV
jgi:hypothetical protein